MMTLKNQVVLRLQVLALVVVLQVGEVVEEVVITILVMKVGNVLGGVVVGAPYHKVEVVLNKVVVVVKMIGLKLNEVVMSAKRVGFVVLGLSVAVVARPELAQMKIVVAAMHSVQMRLGVALKKVMKTKDFSQDYLIVEVVKVLNQKQKQFMFKKLLLWIQFIHF